MRIDRRALEELYSQQRLSQRAVARHLDVTYGTVRYYLKKYDIPTIDRDAFDWNEDIAYILGAMLGDGCAYISYHCNGRSGIKYALYRVDLAVCDELFAKRVFDSAKRTKLRPHWYKPQILTNSIKTYTLYKVGFLSRHLYQLVKDIKEEPFKLLELIQNNKEAIFLLAGFYDAEGHYCNKDKRHYHLQMSNTNIPLLSMLKLILEKIGYEFRLRLVRRDNIKRKALYVLLATRHSTIDSFLEEISGVKR